MKIDQLKSAIITRMLGAANDFKTAIADQFFYVENPNDDNEVSYPYGVFQIITGSEEEDTATKFPNPIVQVTIHDDDLSSATATDCGNKFDTRFNECQSNLVLTDYIVLRVHGLGIPRELKTLNGNWQWSRDYEILLQNK